MTSKTFSVFVLAILLNLAAMAGESVEAAIEDLGWMAGHWRGTMGAASVEEDWLGPAGGTMLGVNRTVADDRTVGFEYLRLEERGGGVVLLASPGGRSPATEFHLIELDEYRAVFSNPGHDFPQRITYRREESRLHAEIEGIDDGKHKKVGWVFERVP